MRSLFIANILSGCSFLSESDKKQTSFLAKILPDVYGETLEIDVEDADFGKLTCSNGVIKMENGKVAFSLDIRFGKNVRLEELKERVGKALLKNGFSVEFLRDVPSRLTDKNNPYIQTCLGVYQTFTGEENAQPRINAGGTYAMYLPCSAEIGTELWKNRPFALPQGHGFVHQPDECISIDGFLKAIELTALMVLACDKVEG
jgi:succinyl-diaminopimelate desuccinylase